MKQPIGKCIFKNKYCMLHCKTIFNCLSTSAKRYAKKKFSIKNQFTFQNESQNSEVISPDLLPERNEFKDQLGNSKFSSRRFVSAELYPQRKEQNLKNNKLCTTARSSKSPLTYKGEILFGVHPVYLALLQKRRVFHHLFTREDVSSPSEDISRKTEIMKLAESMNIPISFLDSRGLRILAPTAVHQGVCLDVGSFPLLSWNEDQFKTQPTEARTIWLVLDEILDPMNVGAIIRSAHYFGVKKLFTVRGNSCKLSPTVSKASSGTLEVMDIIQIENLEDFVHNRKKNGWCIVSTMAYSENCKSDLNVPCINASKFCTDKPIIIIVGNEGRGITQNILNLCDSLISIEPAQSLPKGIDSLNVSVATGVILHALNSFNIEK